MNRPARSANRHANYWAFLVHRLSGLALAAFLPVHFVVLALAIRAEATLESFIRWSDQPLVKMSEVGLVVLLAAHLTGGLRLLAIEFLAWRDWQRTTIAATAGISLAFGLAYLLVAA